MLYLGACAAVSPPGCCTPEVPPCCLAWLDGTVWPSDLFSTVEIEYFTPTWLDSAAGTSTHATLPVPVLISGIDYTVTIPTGLTIVSVCGPITTRNAFDGSLNVVSVDFSGLSWSVSGSNVTVSGSVTSQGYDNGAVVSARFQLGVLVQSGGLYYIVQILFSMTSGSSPAWTEYITLDPLSCLAPCMSDAEAYATGYDTGYSCAGAVDPCPAHCTSCSDAYASGWADGRYDAECGCPDYATGYAAGYADGLACLGSSSPCPTCPTCDAGYAAGWSDGLGESAC
jgi:hypothetical protein